MMSPPSDYFTTVADAETTRGKTRARGRPRASLNEQRLQELARLGLNNRQIATLVGLGPRRFCERLNEKPSLRIAMEMGRAETIELMCTKLYDKAMAGNVSAIRLYLTRRGGFDKRSPLLSEQK